MPKLDRVVSDHAYHIRFIGVKGKQSSMTIITNLIPCGTREEMVTQLSYLSGQSVIEYGYLGGSA